MLRRVSTATLMGFLIWGLSSMVPALADEFDVGIVVGDDVDRSEFMDGFQLAVDESPDISHPPDTEGGDHLGSMDVTLVVSSSGSVLDVGMSPIVVADMSTDALDTMSAGTATSPAMVIVFTDAAPPGLPATGSVLAITRSWGEHMASSLSSSFEVDFAALHGYQPSSDAARGYTAGKLIDIAVEATDRDPTDAAALRTALNAVATDEAATEMTLLPATGSTSPPTEFDGRSLVPPGLIAAIAVILVIVASMYIGDSHRRRPPDQP